MGVTGQGLVVEATPDGIERHLDAWTHLAHAGDSLYKTPEWILALWNAHFGASGVEFLFDYQEGRLAAVVPVFARAIRKFGIPMRVLGPINNRYGENHHELALYRDARTSLERVLDAIVERGWDVLEIGSVVADGPTHRLLRDVSQGRCAPLFEMPGATSPTLMLDDTRSWDAFVAGKSSNFRADMKRKWNKAASAGVEISVVTHAQAALDAFDMILDVERRSWKQAAGTSITVQATAERFYRDFLPRAANRGWLRLYLAQINDRTLAYDLGVCFAGTYYALKTSFDAGAGELSPGVVIRQRVLRDAFELGMREHDFLGDADDYKRRWTKQSRKHVDLFLYNPRSWRARASAWAERLRRPETARGAA